MHRDNSANEEILKNIDLEASNKIDSNINNNNDCSEDCSNN